MQYLVDKYDTERRFSYAPEDPEYYEQLSWLMWQMGGLGPMQGTSPHYVALDSSTTLIGFQIQEDGSDKRTD